MLAKALAAAAKAVEPAYVEDVFQTWLYTGNGSTQTITNGVDLAGKGGLVWSKPRAAATFNDHIWVDSARGDFQIQSNSTAANNAIASFNFASTGYTVPNNTRVNESGINYASWTFRKQAKFFDVVTWTGDGASSRSISHLLGSLPGCIIVKRTNSAAVWTVWHRSLASVDPASHIYLSSTGASVSNAVAFTTSGNTTTTFSVGAFLNASSATYVAYVFAHDAGGFGDAGTDSVIKCGSFTTDGSGNATVDLGWEPQWVMMKNSQSAEGWWLTDNMRGNSLTSYSYLFANATDAEASASGNYIMAPTATGFLAKNLNASKTYTYIAIRRGPMKTPTDATKVFNSVARSGTGANSLVVNTTVQPDLIIQTYRNADATKDVWDRLRGAGAALQTTGTGDETANAPSYGPQLFANSSYTQGSSDGSNYNASGYTFIDWVFRRAPGFFDVVAYTGTQSGSGSQTVSHNLGVAPELLIHRQRNASGSWMVHALFGSSDSKQGTLNSTGSFNTSTYATNDVIASQPTSTQVAFGWPYAGLSNTFIVYLFASVSGVSKVGSYTGTGTTLSIDCGFTAGARFVLIKRIDSTGAWYVWDSARGIIAGNDPYLLLNSTAAEVTNTDYVDTYSAGFEISSTAPAAINANGGTFIFLAVA